ncbi:MAG: hypothetical protein AAGI49_05400 [Bacteroidota bacterium]
MKKRYDIKFNSPELSSERINSHKDFDALLASFEQTKPPQKDRTIIRRIIWMSGAIAAALIGVVFWFNQSTVDTVEDYQKAATAYFEEQAFINPPFENIRPTFASYQVNSEAGGTYAYGENSKIIIPATAFQDDRGQALEGEVDLFYREMHDPVDFFLSGIPLTYDSAGVSYTLESAGMIEIYAEQDGKRVRMMPGKTIDIELASEIDMPFLNVPPKYNIYKLDTEARNWVYQEVDRISVLTGEGSTSDDPIVLAYQNQVEKINAIAEQALAALEERIPMPVKPQQPRQRNSGLPSLELDFLDSFGSSAEADAIRQKYDGAIWQLSAESPSIPADAASEEWEDFEMKEKAAGLYELTLIKGDRRVNMLVEPVLLDGQYAEALAQYEAGLLAYEQAVSKRKDELADEIDSIETERTNALAAANNDLQATQQSNVNVSPSQRRKVVSYFKADSFGIWNCDRPVPPSPQKARLAFQDENGATYNNTTAYLLNKNRNSVERFLVTENTILTYDSNAQNLLWIVVNESQIALMRPADFKALAANPEKRQNVTLDLIDQPIRSEADVRKVVQL